MRGGVSVISDVSNTLLEDIVRNTLLLSNPFQGANEDQFSSLSLKLGNEYVPDEFILG
jgi:hypothetical protein